MNYFKISKFFLYLVPLMVVIVTSSTLFPFIVGKYVFFRIAVDLALIFFLLGLFFDKHRFFQSKDIRSPKINNQYLGDRMSQILKLPLVIAVTIFVIIFLLACLFGVDPKMSFWSNFERGEGGLQLLHLWVFFMLLVALFREEKDWQRLFVIAIIGGLGMAFYGFLAGVGAQGVIGPKFGIESFRFIGSIGNAAYVAAYAIFMMFYTAYLLSQNAELRGQTRGTSRKSPYKSAVLWFLMAVFIVVFFAAATRGAFLGLIASVLVFIGYLAFSSQRWRKWFIVAGLGLVILVMLLIQFKNTPFIKSLPISRIFDISFSTQTFHDRAIMWQIAIDGFKERPLFGWGPENYLKIFDRHFNTKYFTPSAGFGAWFDRAHNVYFDYLAETGILGLLSFLSIFGVFYWQFFKKTRTLADFKKTRTYADNNSKLLYEDITYKIRGAIFDIKRQLGLGHKEIIYQNALEEEFNKKGILFEREKPLDIMYGNKKVGVYKPDFIIENKIILELKSLPFLGRNEKKQIWHYLRGLPYQLALLVNFGQKNDVQIERIICAPNLLSQPVMSAKSVLSPLESALIFALPIAYLVQGIVLFDVLPIYMNVFLFLAFAAYRFEAPNFKHQITNKPQ